MATCAMPRAWPALGEMWRSSSTCRRTLLNAHVCHNATNLITTHIQKRSLFASLGGTTALFVGASVLTVVETMLFIVRHLVDYVTFRWTVRRLQILD